MFILFAIGYKEIPENMCAKTKKRKIEKNRIKIRFMNEVFLQA